MIDLYSSMLADYLNLSSTLTGSVKGLLNAFPNLSADSDGLKNARMIADHRYHVEFWQHQGPMSFWFPRFIHSSFLNGFIQAAPHHPLSSAEVKLGSLDAVGHVFQYLIDL